MKNIIQKSVIPDSKTFVIRELNEPHFDPTFHLHPEYQLSYVTKGEGTRFIGDSVKSFGPGDMVLTGPNLPHVWRNDHAYFEKKNNLSTTVIVMYFHHDFLGELTHQKEELETITRLFHKSERGLEITGETHAIISKMMKELLTMSGVDSIVQLLKLLDVLANSNDCHAVTHNHSDSLNTEAETDRMNKVYGYIMKNFRQKIVLEDVAAVANMTRTSFCRYFKSRVNKSYSDFLKEIRVEYACKLLKEDKMNINLIGCECGFQSPSNFHKQFKKVMGKQPLHYKNEYMKAQLEPY
ncbi:AraC family transcriptional regulator [Hufsiella ginkgonis]|uniref:Helix-turn-helix domain-containing protein n=1 Tax=Hufsiella ginkgonis TaxID=2695274 RepID=A0A7K1Y045_9SPHI|nr:AraC family transcriptional regulator [Hufsiella ginkgonis]MXV16369.1 helix-turn-helix domain-containing protein [Hufsiella ginkgonis]